MLSALRLKSISGTWGADRVEVGVVALAGQSSLRDLEDEEEGGGGGAAAATTETGTEALVIDV